MNDDQERERETKGGREYLWSSEEAVRDKA
jgi:hypothetical protein